MNEVLFPSWQLDRAEYEAICAHLGLPPDAAIHERLNAYLARAPFRLARPRGFSAHLARGRLGRFRVARLDQATKLLDHGHPLRHRINAVLALHECVPEGWAQMANVPTGWRLGPAVATWLLRWLAGLALTLPWLAVERLRHALAARRDVDLSGQCVLVTGCARGLGLDILLECLEWGAQVIGVVRSEAAAAQLRARLPDLAPLQLLAADLSERGSLVGALTKAGVDPSSIRLAVLCAGVKHDGVDALALPELRDTFEVNFFAIAELASWFCDTKAGTPRALALVSSMGRWHGMHSSGGYNASKAALSIWGESIELDLARRAEGRPPTVTLVEPGLFESDMVAGRRGLANRLMVTRRRVAERIVAGAVAGRRVLRPPAWFAWLTWGTCVAGRTVRRSLFLRAKS